MRAAVVTQKHSARQATKKTSATLIDQGLFWAQIRKYQLTKTYRDLGDLITEEKNALRANEKPVANNHNDPLPPKPSAFRRMSTALGLSKPRPTTVQLRRYSYNQVQKLNRDNPKLNAWEQPLNINNKRASPTSTTTLNHTCCSCCSCCAHTPTFDPVTILKMCWDFFVASLIFYSVLMIPYTIGFNVDPPEAMLLFNWLVDCTFAVDMLFNFFTGFHVEGGSLVTNKCVIAIRYLKGWFVIDLFSTLPIDTIATAIMTASGKDGSSGGQLDQQLRALKLIRGLRLLRLLKLARLFKLKKLAALLDQSDFFHPAMIKVFGLLFKIVFVGHVLSCFWFLVGSPESNVDRPYDGWVTELNLNDETDAVKYSWSFYWTVATMMAVGYGDVYPRTTQEMLYAIAAQTIGALMFGLIIGTVSNVLEAIDARGHVIKRKSDEVTDWMRSRKLPRSVRAHIRNHFEYVSHIKSAFQERFILERLPNSLRSAVTKYSYSDMFNKIHFLHSLSDGFLHELLLMMTPIRISAGECLWRPGNRCRHLYVLRQGLAQYEVPRIDLDNWSKLPVTQQRKDQLMAEKKKLQEQKKRGDKKVAAGRPSKKNSATDSVPGISSKYAVNATPSPIDQMFVPLAVYNDGGHFGDERIRPLTINARVLVVNVSDFFVLPLDELHHLYMMYTDDALVFQSSAENRVRMLCKVAKNLIQPPPASSPMQKFMAESTKTTTKATMNETTSSASEAGTINNTSNDPPVISLPAAAAEDSTNTNNLPPTSTGVDIDGDGKADFSVSDALNVYSERLSLDDSLSLDHEELEVHNRSRAPRSTNAKPSPGLGQEQAMNNHVLSRKVSFQSSSINAHKKDWMPLVHNGEYCNRGMCSAFWPSSRGGYGQAELFRTIRPSIDEEQWNVIAKESEQRRNISLYTEGTNGSPTSFNQSQQASIDFNNNKTTGIEAETKTAEPSEEQKQVDASGRVYTSTTITEEDQDDLWERYIIYPQRPEKIKWDMCMAFLIVYSVAIIPYRICFSMEATGIFLFLDRCIDVLFTVDMLLTFRTAYFTRIDKLFITIPKQISINYLQTWFAIDFLSTFPVDSVVLEIMKASDASSSTSGTTSTGNDAEAASQVRALKLIRTLRLVRLLKLARLLKLGKFLKSVEDYLNISPAAFKLMKLVFNVTFIAHLLACFWYYVSSLESDEEPSNWWNSQAHLIDAPVEVHYVSSLYWAFTTMTTVGYGDLTPQTQSERTYSSLAMILGATVFGYIVGNVSRMVGQLDVGAARQREQRAMIRNYMLEQDLPSALRMKMDRFFDFYYQRTSIFDESAILKSLPSDLKRTVVMHINKKLLQTFWNFFGRIKNELRCELLIALKPSFCLKNERLYNRGDGATEMYFLQQGTIRIIVGGGKKVSKEQHKLEVESHVVEEEEEEIKGKKKKGKTGNESQREKQKQKQNQKEEKQKTNDTKTAQDKQKSKTNLAKNKYRDIEVGQVFGCVEYVLGSSRNDTALAIDYVTLMVLPRTSVWAIVAGAPDLANDVQHLLAGQLDKEIPSEEGTGMAKGVFEGIKLKTQNNFLKKFRLKNKSKKDMVEGEMESLGSDHKVASALLPSVLGINKPTGGMKSTTTTANMGALFAAGTGTCSSSKGNSKVAEKKTEETVILDSLDLVDAGVDASARIKGLMEEK